MQDIIDDGILCCFSSTIGVPGKTMGTMFTPVQVEVVAYEPERVGGMFIILVQNLLACMICIDIKYKIL